jgi:hypothetical protein
VWNIGSIRKGEAMQTATGIEYKEARVGYNWEDAANACFMAYSELPQLAEKMRVHPTTSAKYQFIIIDCNWGRDSKSVHERFTAAMWLGIRIAADRRKNDSLRPYRDLADMRRDLEALMMRLLESLPVKVRQNSTVCRQLEKN